MIKQEIHIIGHDTLYNILDEIKNNLSFKILNYHNKSDFSKKIKSNKTALKNSLFIMKKFSDYLTKDFNIDEKQIFLISNTPIDINNMVEKMNIQLIKIRYNYQSKVFLKNYTLDLNSREINRDNKK